ncbi:hypothetical protein AWH60_13620 [Pseudoalteromonas haloplanktis]|nr:hypothetical protein AWH60_13620 [Pseudoalteromonas haloplanktis]
MLSSTEIKNKQAKQTATLARLSRFSHITDSSIGIPFTKFKFGVESLIGLLPVIGDLAGLILSGYVLIEAQRLGVSKRVKSRIIINMLIDFVGGLIPFFGDIFDAMFKANTRNTRILKKHLTDKLTTNP